MASTDRLTIHVFRMLLSMSLCKQQIPCYMVCQEFTRIASYSVQDISMRGRSLSRETDHFIGLVPKCRKHGEISIWQRIRFTSTWKRYFICSEIRKCFIANRFARQFRINNTVIGSSIHSNPCHTISIDKREK